MNPCLRPLRPTSSSAGPHPCVSASRTQSHLAITHASLRQQPCTQVTQPYAFISVHLLISQVHLLNALIEALFHRAQLSMVHRAGPVRRVGKVRQGVGPACKQLGRSNSRQAHQRSATRPKTHSRAHEEGARSGSTSASVKLACRQGSLRARGAVPGGTMPMLAFTPRQISAFSSVTSCSTDVFVRTGTVPGCQADAWKAGLAVVDLAWLNNAAG